MNDGTNHVSLLKTVLKQVWFVSIEKINHKGKALIPGTSS